MYEASFTSPDKASNTINAGIKIENQMNGGHNYPCGIGHRFLSMITKRNDLCHVNGHLLVWSRVTIVTRVSRASDSLRIQRPIKLSSCVDSLSLDTNYLHPYLLC